VRRGQPNQECEYESNCYGHFQGKGAISIKEPREFPESGNSRELKDRMESKGIRGIHGCGGKLELVPRVSTIWGNLLAVRFPR
jgi:hypothetical protein